MNHIVEVKNHAPAASPQPQRAADANSLASTLEATLIKVEPAVYRWPVGQSPSPKVRAIINALIADADRKLSALVPDDGGEIVEQVSEQVYASFKARDPKTTEHAVYDGFLIALPGRSRAAVSEAVRRIIRSEAPAKYSRTFVPTAGELAELSIAIEDEWRLGRSRLVRILEIKELAVEPPVQVLSREKQGDLARAQSSIRRP